MRLRDNVAVITGAAGGIGRGIALKFAAEGSDLLVTDRSLLAAESVSGKVEEMGRKAIPAQGDVSKMADMKAVFQQAASTFGKVDILVCCAGVRKDAPINELSEDQWDEVIRVGLTGAFNCVKCAQEYMVQQQSGKIIVVGSPVPSGLGGPGQANYSAANAGLRGLITALAVDLGPYNINVNGIAPDFVETQMLREAAQRDGLYMDDFKKAVMAHIPLRRLGTPEDIANVALFLASDESAYVTGQMIAVRGGP